MTKSGVSRRKALEVGACALGGAAALLVTASAHAGTGQKIPNEDLVRKWYGAWERKDVGLFLAMMASDFTFTSAAGDDHINASVFKTRCWDTQTNFIDRFVLEKMAGSGNEVFVKYLCYTKNGKSFRNVEYLRFKGEKVEAVECYFGGNSTFPSAVSKG